MGVDQPSQSLPKPALDGSAMRVALITARWNSKITLRLLEGARRALTQCGVEEQNIFESWVPGAFELPLAAKWWAESARVDAIACFGCVIRGETTHYEAVAGECASGISRVQLDTGVPVSFSALTVENLEQALSRSEGPGGHNVGADGIEVIVEMFALKHAIERDVR